MHQKPRAALVPLTLTGSGALAGNPKPLAFEETSYIRSVLGKHVLNLVYVCNGAELSQLLRISLFIEA